MKFRPCIDLHAGQVKQIIGSTLTDNDASLKTNFESQLSASIYAEMYQRDGLFGGHVIMLGQQGNESVAIQALGAFPNGMHVGGGISPINAKKYLEAGASHVIVTSYVFRDGKIDYKRLEEMVNVVGKDHLVLDLSCRKKNNTSGYFVVTDRWQVYTDFEITQENLVHLSQYCAEFLVHGVDVEGMRVGVMEDLVEKLGKWSPIPVTYAGGARSLEDFEIVNKLGNGKVDLTVGSALDIFGGDLKYDQVVKWHYANLTDDEIEHSAEKSKLLVCRSIAKSALSTEQALEQTNNAFRLALGK